MIESSKFIPDEFFIILLDLRTILKPLLSEELIEFDTNKRVYLFKSFFLNKILSLILRSKFLIKFCKFSYF